MSPRKIAAAALWLLSFVILVPLLWMLLDGWLWLMGFPATREWSHDQIMTTAILPATAFVFFLFGVWLWPEK